MGNKHKKIMPKIQQNMFGGQAVPYPLVELMHSPRPVSHNAGLLLTGKWEEEGKWTTSKGRERRREGIERENSPKVKVNKINIGTTRKLRSFTLQISAQLD